METTLLIIITVLLLLAIVLIIALRNKGNNDLPQIQIKIDELQNSLSRIEKNLKEEFRLNRLENTTNAKADREELTKAIGDFRTEIMTSVKTMTDQNSSALEKLNQTLEQKVSTLIEKNMSAFNGFQESFDKNVRSFNELQKEKFELMESKQNDFEITSSNSIYWVIPPINPGVSGLSRYFPAVYTVSNQSLYVPPLTAILFNML